MNEYLFFWGHDPHRVGKKACLSNWYHSPFVYKGIRFANNEQWMMYQKAKLFGDNEVAEKILQETDPKKVKALGRMVRNFDVSVWEQKSDEIVFRGAFLKFSQNPDLRDFLLNTGAKRLVEASPYDKIWGIGLTAKQAYNTDSKDWPGLNKLGHVLERVREHPVIKKSGCEIGTTFYCESCKPSDLRDVEHYDNKTGEYCHCYECSC